jgi:hypothetical protein
MRLFLSAAGSVNKCPQIQENPPELKLKENLNYAQTPKQENNTTAYLSETNQPTIWSSDQINDPTILNVLADMELNGRSKSIINGTRKALNLISQKTQLNNPQEVRNTILRLKTGNAYKRLPQKYKENNINKDKTLARS